MIGECLRLIILHLTLLSLCFRAHVDGSGCELVPGRSDAVVCTDVGDLASVQGGKWTQLLVEGCVSGLDWWAAPATVRRLVLRRCDGDPLTPEAFTTLRSLEDLTLESDHFPSAGYPLFCNNNTLLNLTIVDTTFGGDPDEDFIRNVTQMCNKLTFLSLNDLDVSKIREHDFDNVVALTSLDLGSNSIRILEAESFKKLINLQYLSLYNNLLFSLTRDVFLGLSTLKILRLDQNNIRTLPNHVFDNLQHLKELNLSGNSLQHMQKPVLENLNSLEKLSIADNDIKNVDQLIFNTFQNLVLLDMSGNNIEELGSDVFAGLTKLDFLQLQNNNIKNIQPRVFASLSSISILNLSNNNIETISGDPFTAENSNLRSLNLATNNIRDLQPRCFIDLVNLEELNVSYNLLDTFSDDLLGSGASLRSLDVSHNRLSRLGDGVRATTLRIDHNRLSAWSGWARVRRVALHHNPWQCACVRAMLGELRARRVALLEPAPLDGKAPLCVVLRATECVGEPYALPGYDAIIDTFIENSYKE